MQHLPGFLKSVYSYLLFISYVRVITGPAHNYIFSFANHNGIQPGEIGFSLPQRRWTNVGLEQIVQVFYFFYLN